MRRFSLYRRNQIYYVRWKNPDTGRYAGAVSTGETEESAALAAVYYMERHGIPDRSRSVREHIQIDTILDRLRGAENLSTDDAARIVEQLKKRGLIVGATIAGGPAAEILSDWLLSFWDWNASPYVSELRAHGHSITRGHCLEMASYVRRYWEPHFKTKRVGEVSRSDLRDFGVSLADRLSPQTINHCLNAGSTALQWAHVNGLIPDDPTKKLKRFVVRPKKRDVLTADEIRRLYSIEWPDSRARLASLVAMTTGLRAGEIAALTVDDIGDDRLHVRHSWSKSDGLKSPKTGETRSVPLLPAIRDQLREQAALNPWGGSFVFWSTVREDRPVSTRLFSGGLVDALVLLDLPQSDLEAWRRVVQQRSRKVQPDPDDARAWERVEEIRKRWRDRGVVFHSWRHYYAAKMADRLEARQVMTATGHRSATMFEHYAAHADAETFREVAIAAGEAFSNIIPFPGTGTEG